MELTNMIELGERVDLLIGQENHRSTVQEVPDQERLIVLHPFERSGAPASLPEGTQVDVVFYRDNGQFIFSSTVQRRFREGDVALLELKALSDAPQRFQRRGGYRLPCRMAVQLLPVHPARNEEKSYNVRSVDISDGGLQVEFPVMASLGALYEVDFQLLDDEGVYDDESIELRASVCRILPPEQIGRPWRMGLRFLDYPEELRRKIARFILKEQINHRRMNKLP